jgi:L-2-hydroxyglutarate oxidase
MRADAVIVGGGIVGLAVGYLFGKAYPDRSLVVLEKEATVARHQTGHNSGVLHTGVYYKPGSYKARNCTTGKKLMEQFCTENGVPYELCGKVIVATSESELPALTMIHQRGQANGVECAIISAAELREIEPHVNGIQAIRVPQAGIVDYTAVAAAMAQQIDAQGGKVLTSAALLAAERRDGIHHLTTAREEITAKLVINCAGLHCDRVARMLGAQPKVKIIPFRGEYYSLTGSATELCRHLIYPVPNPDFPFLGVHFTRMISGEVECGPNAVLAFAREGYRKSDINLADLAETLTYRGFHTFILKHLRMGAAELWRSFSKAAFVRSLQKLIPAVQSKDLESAPAGVRAQAITDDGKFVDDFVIEETPGALHVLNAPSPAATSSLSLATFILEQAGKQVDWARR